jgi:hypothetical protein
MAGSIFDGATMLALNSKDALKASLLIKDTASETQIVAKFYWSALPLM